MLSFLVSTNTEYISIAAFASLIDIPIEIMSFAQYLQELKSIS